MAELAVGGAFLSAFLQVLFDRLASKEVVDFFHGKKHIVDLLNELNLTLLSATSLLNDAEEKQLQDQTVRKWLNDFKEVVHEADEVVDEINTEALRRSLEAESDIDNIMSKMFLKFIPTTTFGEFDNPVQTKIVGILGRLKLVIGQKDVIGLKAGVQNRILQRLPTPLAIESGVYGRDDDKDAIIKLLLSNDDSGNRISVIPIVGMGGIGKTTLAQLIFDDFRVKEHFESKVWITVLDEYDVVKILKLIFESITCQKCDIEDSYKLQVKLKEALEGRKFLIVLDDVWKENYSSCLASAFDFGANGGKIMVTTRSRTVAQKMGDATIYDLQVISDNDCWKLFATHAFSNVELDDACPELKKIGSEIVAKCKGLPLAIKSLAGLLRSQFNQEEWRRILRNDIWDLHWQENGSVEVIPALWMSYQYLPSHLKQCFAYCSIFPKGFKYEKRQLILLWMAEGILHQYKSTKRMEDVGEECINALISRSLFQQSSWNESTIFMHDLVHDLANFVSGKFCVRLDDNSNLNNLTENTRYLSYVGGKFEFNKLEKLSSLRTFLSFHSSPLHGVTSLPDHIAMDKILSSIGRLLKTLSLSGSFIKELPNSVANMKYLRYLDLSSTEITELPDTVCALYNLQTLLLAYCTNLIRLPMKIGNLIKLRHLDISNTISLKEMPSQICKLKELETLTDFVLGRGQADSSIKELGELQNLSGILKISGLENVVNVGDVLEAKLKDKKRLNGLILRWGIGGNGADDSQKEREILDALKPHTNLKQLYFFGYRGTILSDWVGHHSFSNVVEVRLHSCKNCCLLPPFGQLPYLKKLEIWGCDSVVIISSEFSKSFQSLEILHFWNMPEWKEWSFSTRDGVVFPRLKELYLEDCPKLNVHLPDYLPSLTTLQVLSCKQLMPLLPRDHQMDSAFPCLKNMKISGCPEQKSFLEGGLPLSLTSLRISFCDELEAFDEECFGVLSCLKELEIHDCVKFMEFPITEIPDHMTLSTKFKDHIKKKEMKEFTSIGTSRSINWSYSELRNKQSEEETVEDRGRQDMQGIPWDKLPMSREGYRQRRTDKYKNHENIPFSGEMSRKDYKITEKGLIYYEFKRNAPLVKPHILHFQLRNLVWTTSKYDVYLHQSKSIVHWSSLTSSRSEVLNVSRHVAPSEKHPGSLLEGFTTTDISTIAVKDKLLVAGGFNGELICKALDWPGVSYCYKTTYDNNAITNSVEIYSSPSGAIHFLASSNDCGIREFNMQRFQLSKHLRFSWPVNHCSLSPDSKLLVVVGDNPNGMLVDPQTGKTVEEFSEHKDYSFSSSWHPNGVVFATGSQDKTCRVWDIRNLSKSVAVLGGNLAAIHSIRFTSDGRYMAAAEAVDYVHIYDVKSKYEKEQVIDFFGQTSGISFSPEAESLFIGANDRTYGGILEYGRHV